MSPREEQRTGLAALEAVTTLLQRVRNAHPTKGLYEAADFQWWWRNPRSSDEVPQLFWFDDHDRPEAAAMLTHWGDGVALDPIVMPDAPLSWAAHVVERGLAHASASGIEAVEVMIDGTDEGMRGVLTDLGLSVDEDGRDDVESWLSADARPEVSPLAESYRLCSRLETTASPHHLIKRSGTDVEARLRQTSLYRPDLDLVVLDDEGATAAYGVFWHDPVTETGLVEPMRTEDDHQRRGLARHVLTAGLERLAAAGSRRIKIVSIQDNPAARTLYESVGFQPVKETIVLAGPTGSAAAT